MRLHTKDRLPGPHPGSTTLFGIPANLLRFALAVCALWAGRAQAQDKLLDWDLPENQWDFVSELAPNQDSIEHLFSDVDGSGVNFTLRLDPVRGEVDTTSLTDPTRDSLQEMLTKDSAHAGIQGLFDFHNPDSGNANDPDFTLNLGWNEPDRDDGLRTTFTFSQAVRQVYFDVFDIDKLKWSGSLGAEQTGEPRGWIDEVTITGWVNGSPVSPIYNNIPSSSNGSVPANPYHAAGEADPWQFVGAQSNTLTGRWEFNQGGNFGALPDLSDWATNDTYGGDGNVLTVNFPTPVDSITIEHQNLWSDPGSSDRDKPDAYWGGKELEIGIGDIFFNIPEVIRDRVWIDLNQDGAQDPGEPGLPGVGVQLLTGFSSPILDGNGQPIIATTDASGGYYLLPPSPGFYKLQLLPPTGFTTTSTNAAVDTADNDFFSNFRTSTINISPGEDDRTVDAGLRPRSGAFSETVFLDLDADGVQGAGESGMAGVTVRLLDGGGSTVLATAVTDSEGIYYLDQIAAGSYLLEFVSPAGFAPSPQDQGGDDTLDSDIDPATNRTGVIALATNAVNTVTGAGFFKLGSIGNRVFNDRDGDGKQDANEIGLPGVTVVLHDASGSNPLQTTTSGPTGQYLFADLPPATYVVEFVRPSGGFGTVPKDATTDDLDSDYNTGTRKTDPLVLGVGQKITHLDAGFDPPENYGQIGDRVWEDRNENGLQDPGEPGLDGFTVHLLRNDSTPRTDTQGNPVTTVTADGGYYNFVVKAEETRYRIGFPTGPFASLATPLAGGNTALDSDPDPVSEISGSLQMDDDQVRTNVDAGIIKVIVGDLVWIDLDRDGVQDPTEPPLEGVTVELHQTNGVPVLDSAGQPITDLTDSNGAYELSGFLPGSYNIQFTPPAGYLAAPEGATTEDLDSDINASGTATSVDLTAGVPDRTIDAGFLPLGSALGDFVFSDQNGNGIQDVGEPGLAGVSIILIDEFTWDVLGTTTSNAAGAYYFEGLAAGTYALEFTAPGGYGITNWNVGGDDNVDSDIDPADGLTPPIVLGADASKVTIDAGFIPFGSIGDMVFYDKDGDGKFEAPDDFGLPGATVILHDGSGNNALQTTFTTPDGTYRFDRLVPGNYVVEFVRPSDFQTVPQNNAADDIDSDYNESSGKTSTITVGPGEDITSVDAGYKPPDKDGRIGDFVWEDTNGDGIQDPGEPGLGGILVELLESDGDPWLDTGGNPVTTTTLADGSYFFVVKPADYRLRVTPPADTDFTSVGVGSGALDNDVDPATNQTNIITISDDEVNNTIDAGIRYALIGGRIWSDSDLDGTQNPDETGIPGVAVYLDVNGNLLRDSSEPFALSDLDGNYRIGNLAGGTHVMRTDPATLPPGALLTSDPDALPDGAHSFSLTTGQSLDNRDFGYEGGFASLSGQVRNDLDADGDLTDPDSGRGSVVIRLYRDINLDGVYNPGTDVLVTSTTTAPSGGYFLLGLLPGFYILQEIDPAGAISTNDSDNQPLLTAGTDNLLAVTALAGFDSGGHDFLDTASGTNAITGFVINDVNANGLDDSEPGIPLVTVQLFVDPNANGLADDGLSPYATTTTDGTGYYQFTSVPNGNWVIVETDPVGATSTNDISAPGTDSTCTLALHLGSQVFSNVNFLDTGATLRRILGSTYEDTDDDGQFSPGDTLAQGVPLSLYHDANGDKQPDPGEELLQSTTSDVNGFYEFQGLSPANYLVVGPADSPINDVLDSDGTADNGKNEIAVTLGASDATGNNFLVDITTLSGQVREDSDGDGDLADPDAGLAGVTVHLFLDTNENGIFDPGTDTFLEAAATNGSGFYTFTGLANAKYIVVEVDPPGATSTNDADDQPLLAAGMDNWVDVNLGGDKNGVDFLDAGVSRAGISGQVRIDSDGDGDLADLDSGIGGLSVTLFTDPNGDGDLSDGGVAMTVVTGLDGSYAFANLGPGNFMVLATDAAGMTSTNDKDNDPLGPSGTDNRIAVALGGVTSTGNDFLDTSGSLHAIGGRVLVDTDAPDNNTIGPEDLGLGGVGLHLYSDTNGNGLPDAGEPLLGSVFSGSDGSYVFPNLVNGTYAVFEVDPPQAVSESDSDGNPTDNSVGISLYNADSLANDFLDDSVAGFSISGRVTNGSDGIAAVEVRLLSLGGGFISVAYTDYDGAYTVPNLIPGSYFLAETNPVGTTGGSDSDGGAPDLIAVTHTATPNTGNDFVDVGASLAAISGSVLNDGNANNNQIDAGDTPVGAVFIKLVLDLDGDGLAAPAEATVATTYTSTDGLFRFENIPQGDYVVLEVDPPGAVSDWDSDGDTNGNDAIAVTLSGGNDSTGNTFLDDFLITNSVSGIITNDSAALSGVVVELRNQLDALIDHSASNFDGDYFFPNLPDGVYMVKKMAPVGTTGGSDSDGPDNGDDTILAVLTGANLTALDFTNTIDPAILRSVGGQVRNDGNGDGNLGDAADRPLDGVRVSVYADADGDGLPQDIEHVGDTVTLDDGTYQFADLPEGDYLLMESDLPGPGTSTADSGPDNGDPNLIPLALASTDSFGHDFLDTVVPGGYFYDSSTGEILSGGSIAVIPSVFVDATILQNGSNGQYSFEVTSSDTFTLVVTPPAGYTIDSLRPVAGPVLDPAGLPDPALLGSMENPANPGFLVQSSAAANPYYLVFDLSPGDSLLLTNNIPMRSLKPQTFAQFAADSALAGTDAQPVPDGSGSGGNPDGDHYSNLLEHALSDNPTSGVLSHPGLVVEIADPASNRIDASFPRAIGIRDVIYTLEGRDSLVGNGDDGQGWFTIASIPANTAPTAPFTVSDNGDSTETLTVADLAATPGLSLQDGLVRLRVDLDVNLDGIPDTLPSDGTPATSTTKTFGWQTTDYAPGQLATFGSPFTKTAIFGGRVDSISGVSLTVTASAGGVDLRTVIPADGSHYLQVTSGPREGERFDISDRGLSNIILASDPDIFSTADGTVTLNTSNGVPSNADLAGASFLVLPHRTIDDLFDKNNVFAGMASYDPGFATRILFYNNRRATAGFDSLILVDDTIEIKWIYDWDLGLLENQGSTPVDFGSGAFIEPHLGTVTLTSIGMVADHDVAFPLNAGHTMVASPYPLDQTPAGSSGRGYTSANGIWGGLDPSQASNLLFWEGDQAIDAGGSYAGFYKTFMLVDAGPGFQFWTDINDVNIPDLDETLLLKSHRAPFIQLRPGNTRLPHVYSLPQP